MENEAKIRLLLKYEEEFSNNSYNGDLTKTSPFTYIRGTVPILLSAPHSVNHFRNGKIKKAELLTGAIVKLLHQLTGCHIIYKNKNDGYDINYDDLGSSINYKNKVADIIKIEGINILFDIHGMSEDKFLDIDLGTDYNNTLNGYSLIPETMKLFFEEQNIMNIGFNQIFSASLSKTVTKTISTITNIPSIQVEINKIYRNLVNTEDIIRLILCFENIINFFKQENWADNKKKLFKD